MSFIDHHQHYNTSSFSSQTIVMYPESVLNKIEDNIMDHIFFIDRNGNRQPVNNFDDLFLNNNDNNGDFHLHNYRYHNSPNKKISFFRGRFIDDINNNDETQIIAIGYIDFQLDIISLQGLIRCGNHLFYFRPNSIYETKQQQPKNNIGSFQLIQQNARLTNVHFISNESSEIDEGFWNYFQKKIQITLEQQQINNNCRTRRELKEKQRCREFLIC